MRSGRSILMGCAFVVCALPSTALGNPDLPQRWITHGPYGGNITSIVPSVHPGGGMYATVLGHGVFHLESGAPTWTNISSNLGNLLAFAVAQSPADPDVLFAATDHGVYATFDGGRHWELRSGGLSVGRIWSLAFDPVDPLTIYSGGTWQADWHVYKTTDGGATWLPAWSGIPTGLEIRDVIVDPINPDVVYAATEDPLGYVVDEAGVYKSVDGGASWNPAGVELQNKRVMCLTMDPDSNQTLYAGVYAYHSYNGGVYVSHDAGASWTRISTGLPDDLGVSQVTSTGAASDPFVLYAAATYPENILPLPPTLWEARLYKSVDGGQSWQRSADGIMYPHMSAVALDPTDPETVYAGTDRGGIYRSGDAAGQWSHYSVGLERLTVRDVAFDPLDPRVLFAAVQSRESEYCWVDAGVHMSVDGGRNWAPRSQGIHVGGGFWTSALAVSLPVDGADTGMVYAAHCGWNGYRTVDGGENWIWCGGTSGLYNYWTLDVVIDPFTPSVIYMAGAGYEPSWPDVFKSMDCGRTWEAIASELVWAEFMSLAIDPRNPQTIYAGSGWEGVWKTTNGGESWTHTGSEIDGPRVGALLVDPRNSERIFAADCSYDGTGVYISEDGGDHWGRYNEGLTDLQVWALASHPSPLNEATLYAGTQHDGVFRRMNDTEWTPMNEGLADLTVQALTTVPPPQGGPAWHDLYAGTTGGVYRRVTVGDLDADGRVDLADLSQLLAHYGTAEGAAYEDGDLDDDRDVDIADLAGLLAAYGTIGI